MTALGVPRNIYMQASPAPSSPRPHPLLPQILIMIILDNDGNDGDHGMVMDDDDG